MRKSAALLFSCFLLSTAAAATSQTYSITGVMTDIRDDGAGVTFGTPFLAVYSHNDAPQVGSIIEPGRIVFLGGAFSISAGALTLTSGAPSELQVFDNWSSTIGGYNNDDGFFVSGWDYSAVPGAAYLIQFDLWDFEGATLKALSVPSQSQFLQLANNGRFWIRRFESGVETGLAQGALQSISPIYCLQEGLHYS
jgi:hypothetical protein